MKNLQELNDKFVKSKSRYYKKQSAIDFQITALERKKITMKYPHFSEVHLPKLTKLLMPLLGADSSEVLGPFGIRNETTLYLYKTLKHKKKIQGSITFFLRSEGLFLRDCFRDTGDQMIEVTEKMDLLWLIKFARRHAKS
jgi:hypothetical protein